ncbi:anther-specific proline-rich protein APG-like isoform X2 [Tribolium madens]|uniref:anther-specific proline-rich protein APG-like isoform X2 n=1 Tax=Tribolium madens TaxID=41895 RepID=UPI001CF742CA|nr:anther-specific proline-rich protein APG-like isoform X2 [Tribolium madens]
MDVLIPIIIFVLVFILFSVCGFCCKRKREGTVYGLTGRNVTVTSQHISASPVVVPPYPVEPRHPTPQRVAVPAPGPGFATHNPPYPTHNPHPGPGAAPAPYPPAGVAPYPPAVGPTPYPPAGPSYPSTGPPISSPYPDYGAQPPSYSEAISQPPMQPLPAKEGYTKQAPYNPNY